MIRKTKDSGIKWIGEIPEDWEMIKVKWLFTVGRGRVIAQTELKEDGLYPVYSSQTKNNGCLGYIDTYDFDKKQLTWTTDGANAGTVFLREGKYNCTNVCGTLLPKLNDDLNFLKYALEYIAIYHKRSDTNGYKIMNNEMAEIKITRPKIFEQKQIANFLDKKCTIIDETIEKEKQVIDKLKEYKQSVITETVTKGLNPDVEMKDSGIEWIGDIPEHWNISRLKYICDIIMGQSPSSEYYNTEGKGVTFLQGNSDFTSKYPEASIFTVNASKYSKLNDVLLSVRAPVGAKNISDKIYAIGRGLCALRAKKVDAKFLWYLVDIINMEFKIKSKGSTYDSVTISDVMNAHTTICTIEEQKQIADYLDRKCSEIDTLISNKEKLIDKLTEYKKSLIYECVTGKREIKDK